MPDPLFGELLDDMTHTHWAPVSQLRTRARRRVWRTRAGTAAAMCATAGVVLSGVMLTTVDRPQAPSGSKASDAPAPGPVTSASSPETASPSAPPTITDAMFLQPTDVGRRNVRFERPVVDGGESAFVDKAGLACRNTPPRRSTLVPVERGLRSLTEPEDLVLTDQWVARYHPADAVQYLNQVRAAVADCSPYPNVSVTTVAHFAGQDSLLVRIEIGPGGPAIQSDPVDYVFVRQGDLVTEFEWAGTNDTAEQVGRRAAARLCAGTPTC